MNDDLDIKSWLLKFGIAVLHIGRKYHDSWDLNEDHLRKIHAILDISLLSIAPSSDLEGESQAQPTHIIHCA